MNKIWWYKLEPLALTIQASFQKYYSPSSEVSINELMVWCFGRLVILFLYLLVSLLILIDLYIRTKCRINQYNRSIKYIEL